MRMAHRTMIWELSGDCLHWNFWDITDSPRTWENEIVASTLQLKAWVWTARVQKTNSMEFWCAGQGNGVYQQWERKSPFHYAHCHLIGSSCLHVGQIFLQFISSQGHFWKRSFHFKFQNPNYSITIHLIYSSLKKQNFEKQQHL